MIAQVIFGNAALGTIAVIGGVVVFVALVWAWLHEELDELGLHDHHGRHRQ